MRHQCIGVPQGVHETAVADVDQHGIFGNWQHIELGLDHIPERALCTAQHTVEVETALLITQVRQVVTGQAAVEFVEDLLDQLGFGFLDVARRAVHLASTANFSTGLIQFSLA